VRIEQMTFAGMPTNGGYNCGEVASAMQKCIRRGQDEEALYWATELDQSGFGEYVWKRLKIISSEDVGLAEPLGPSTIAALFSNWKEQKKISEAGARKGGKRRTSERLFLVHAVLFLSRAKKSRLVDHAGIVMYEARPHRHAVPDFAIDRHTSEGRKQRRGWTHFWVEGAKLRNKGNVEDQFEAAARAARKD
jgi:replication-associated recombination protein RarA